MPRLPFAASLVDILVAACAALHRQNNGDPVRSVTIRVLPQP